MSAEREAPDIRSAIRMDLQAEIPDEKLQGFPKTTAGDLV